MRVFITGWLNSQYLPGIKRYARARPYIFPLVATHSMFRVVVGPPRAPVFFDTSTKFRPTKKEKFHQQLIIANRLPIDRSSHLRTLYNSSKLIINIINLITISLKFI